MYVPHAPMNRDTVKFAKNYRADQIRAAEQSRIASEFKKPRVGAIRRARAALSRLDASRHNTGRVTPSARIVRSVEAPSLGSR